MQVKTETECFADAGAYLVAVNARIVAVQEHTGRRLTDLGKFLVRSSFDAGKSVDETADLISACAPKLLVVY